MTTKITHLVVNGCSWTYGAGLKNPVEESWAGLIAKRLNLPLVNLALPGCGNDSIHRRTYDYIFQNLCFKNNPLVIVAWSQMTRREAWFNETKSYEDIHIGPDSEIDKFNHHQLGHLLEYNTEDHCRRTLLFQSSLKATLRLFNITHLTTDYSHNEDSQWKFNETAMDIKEKNSEMFNFIHDRFHLSPFSELVRTVNKLPCGHEDIEGHNIIAEFVLSKISELIGEITPDTDSQFLSLKDFENKKYYNTNNNAWYEHTKNSL